MHKKELHAIRDGLTRGSWDTRQIAPRAERECDLIAFGAPGRSHQLYQGRGDQEIQVTLSRVPFLSREA